jgi:MFS transporter, AAHS family, benzoate transport protein
MASINIGKIIDGSKFNRFHMTIFILFIAIISFDGFDMVIYGATLPVLMNALGMDAAKAGIIGSYALIGAALGALGFGFLADMIGRKKVIIICAALFSVGTFATGLTNNPEIFGLFRFMTGLGLGGVMPNVVSLATEYAPAKNRAIMIAAIFSGMQIGGILAAGISIWLIPLYGWRAVYFVGGIPLVLIPLMFRFMPESAIYLLNSGHVVPLKSILGKLSKGIEIHDDAMFEVDKVTEKSHLMAIFSEKRTLSTIFIWIVYFMNMYMIFGLGTWLPKLMMMAGFGFGSGLLFLLTLNLGALAGSNIAGFIADRIGYKRTLVGLYIIAFCSIAMISLTKNFAAVTILVAFAGIGFYGGQNVAHGYVSLFYPPKMRSTAMGFAFGVGRLGAILGPLLAGFLVSLNVSLYVNFLWLAVPGLIAAIAVIVVRDKHGYLKTSQTC